jgi:hypothetical protein
MLAAQFLPCKVRSIRFCDLRRPTETSARESHATTHQNESEAKQALQSMPVAPI